MNGRIVFYSCLALFWLALAVAILMRLHEPWLGQAVDWKRYLAIGMALLMMLWNFVRINRLLQLKKRKEVTDGHSF